MFNFQKLDVYRRSIGFLAVAAELKVPRGRASIGDQLRRAALSVPLNIAEGSGRASTADSGRHYAIARGSAMECAAIVDAMMVLNTITSAQHNQSMNILESVVQMLSKMCRSHNAL